jgi:PAS domain S-box-containing protein
MIAPILTLLLNFAYIKPLTSWLGWTGWLVLLGGEIGLAWRWRLMQESGKSRWGLLFFFILLVPLTNLFLGVRLPAGSALPEPGIPSGPHSPALMFFGALPWMLAGGFLGPIDALIVGLLTGLTRSVWDAHNLFFVLEPAFLAVLFSGAVRQRYRTFFYRAMRQPIVVAPVLAGVYAPVFTLGAFFSVSDAVAARLDYALTNAGPAILVMLGELVVGGLFAQVLAIALPRAWGEQRPLEPSPGERSLQVRILLGVGTFLAVLLVLLILGNWIVAGNAARRMIRDRLSSTAKAAAESVPFFLETGQNLTGRLASDPRLLSESGELLVAALDEQIRVVPYFDALFVLDLQGNFLASYPSASPADLTLMPQEINGVMLAMQGVATQFYTIPPAAGGEAARISFITAIVDADGVPQRILLGRSDLSVNPLTQPLINSLRGMATLSGEGLLIDGEGIILFSSSRENLMVTYEGEQNAEAQFYDLPAPNGTRRLVYYQPVPGHPWGIVLSVPAEQSQQLALDIAAPLTILVLVLALIAMVSLRLTLGVLTHSLQTLAVEAGRIAQGQLDHPLPVAGVDEVGQLSQAFEQMRVRLHARLEELNQLLLVSQGVASTLVMGEAVQPILEAVLAMGASAVNVTLTPLGSDLDEDKSSSSHRLGPQRETYAYLDEYILALLRTQNRLVIHHFGRVRLPDLPPDLPRPGALIAVAMYHESRYYGVLWAAFDQPHAFSEEDVRFLTTLAGQAALAAANARLYRSALVGRQRLAAILASTPDPVLVTDQENRLILANPAARQALGFPVGSAEGQRTERVISQKELRDLLEALGSGKQSAEIVLADGKVYFATASAVIADNRPVGRVCVMRDVTHFKELDALKSDFVSTVSHDLRSPLTLMRGYATMLEMVGELNDQQRNYVQKIIVGVESMSRLVNNLLDLGRIEAGVGLEVEKVAVDDIVKAVVNTLHLQAEHKEIRLQVEMAENTPQMLDADRALLQQALYNLVENAIKYTPQQGSVTLRVKPRGRMVQFEVQDTGIGIAPADQPRLFEKFFRGSQREARAQRGSGLGLAIVRSIVERHGGKIWVESTLGHGSTFYFVIPLAQPHAAMKNK